MIDITNDTLKFIIEEYTLESGVRKLKEKLFEIFKGIIRRNENPIHINRSESYHRS
jgi:ATP-dependent Lon protease